MHNLARSARPRRLDAALLAPVALALAVAAGGCLEPAPDDAVGTTADEIDMSKCDEGVKCPKPKDCGRVWDDAGRKPDWPACAAPPTGGCIQVVLGRFDDMKQYLGCPGYVTLNLKNWTEKINDEFIGCLGDDQLKPPPGKAFCEPMVLLASGSGAIPDTKNQTRTELCQLDACGCKVTVAENKVTVGECPKAKAKKGKKKKDRVCVTALIHADTETEPTTPVEECHDVWSCTDECGPDDDCVDAGAECGCYECAADDDSAECVNENACWDDLTPVEVDVELDAIVEAI